MLITTSTLTSTMSRTMQNIHFTTSEIKEYKKEYQKEYRSRPEVKKHLKEYQKEYYSKPEVKEYKREYQKEYRSRPEIEEHRKNKNYNYKLEVYSVYSKRHSNSNIPCCRCCGETEIDFLSLDHINNDGAKHRKEVTHVSILWARKNNFPTLFQVLCMNCNFSKGKKGNNGKCVHEKGESK